MSRAGARGIRSASRIHAALARRIGARPVGTRGPSSRDEHSGTEAEQKQRRCIEAVTHPRIVADLSRQSTGGACSAAEGLTDVARSALDLLGP
ncbi:hypothetical protein GCM10023152_08360 [Agromyces bauzanensis]|uniref:Uncharacterized protein n=1 Tax=Agromyces bauzanensis TaxID=1308924 RepID=A0A917UVF9_9MICO|nr:hypothetical protein GCM10011372_27680 [Agromyces bauzanensis]